MDSIYDEINRLALADNEKKTLRAYFIKNPPQAEQATAALRSLKRDKDKVECLKAVLEPIAGNDFVTRRWGVE
jgi:hypothetical protein